MAAKATLVMSLRIERTSRDVIWRIIGKNPKISLKHPILEHFRLRGRQGYSSYVIPHRTN